MAWALNGKAAESGGVARNNEMKRGGG